jgi:hypothetical protein
VFLDESLGAVKIGGMTLIATGVAGVMFGPMIEGAVRSRRRSVALSAA